MVGCLVYPMVVYHAERAYPYSTDINDLVNAPRELIDRYFLKPFQLIDLAQIEDEELKKHAWSGIMEFAMKHIFARDIMPYFQDIIDVLQKLDQFGGRDYIFIVLQYLMERGNLKDKQAFFKLIETKISKEVGKTMMSIADQLRAEGVEKGIEKGIQKGIKECSEGIAERLLAEGLEEAFIVKMTQLSLERIRQLRDKNQKN